jgi:hypothetical protein
MTRTAATLGGLAVTLATCGAASLRAAEPPLALTWAQLIPAAPPKPPKSFLAGRPNATTPPPPDAAEARWMSAAPKSSGVPPDVVASLDKQRVRIGGYVVPLDFDATQVKEFLLVPFVGACIHVPPPPANQIIYVKSIKGFDVKGTFDPVYVTGKLTTTVAFTGLAEAGYSLDAEAVEPRKE